MKYIFHWTSVKHMTTTLVLLYFWTRWMMFPMVIVPLWLLVWWVERNKQHV